MENCDSFYFKEAVEAIINQMGSAPLTKNVFLELSSRRSLCDILPWLCAQGQNINDPSIEDIFIAAANLNDSKKFQQIVENFIDYMGLDLITDKLFRATVYNCLPDAFQWLFYQRPDLNMTWEGTCLAILQDMDISAKKKLIPLSCLELPFDVDSLKISPSLLAKYPYDVENGNNYGLDDLIKKLVDDPGDDALPISDPQGMAEIVLERCDLMAVNNFLKTLPEILISKKLIQAAKKNVIANRDELMLLLEKE
ncbi:hypothetical protein N7540_003739 [Penicillium herquei]|nr:hypothetical protein N7540_003739 [Penicillium herquei]